MIDVSSLKDEQSSPLQEATIAQLHDTFANLGFAYIAAGDIVDMENLKVVYANSKAFFASPLKDKQSIALSVHKVAATGYVGLGMESTRHYHDWKESLRFIQDYNGGLDGAAEGKPLVLNQYPDSEKFGFDLKAPL